MSDGDLPVAGGGHHETPIEIRQQAAVDRIQHALADQKIEFSQVEDLFEAVYAATDGAAVEAAVAGLPEMVQPPPPVNSRHFAPSNSFGLIGDVKIGGWLAVGPEIGVTVLIGDAVVDVSAAAIPETGLDINLRAAIGDLKVIVPDGARVQTSLNALIGSRKEQLVTPVPDGPIIRINAFICIGDAAVYSLSAVPEGKLRRIWAALRKTND